MSRLSRDTAELSGLAEEQWEWAGHRGAEVVVPPHTGDDKRGGAGVRSQALPSVVLEKSGSQ